MRFEFAKCNVSGPPKRFYNTSHRLRTDHDATSRQKSARASEIGARATAESHAVE